MKSHPFHRAAAAALLTLAVGAAQADAQDTQTEAQRAGTETQRHKQETRAAADAARLAAAGEGGVSYEQVMADPDNLELNYRWANSQVRRGDLKGASATLERVLLVDPDQYHVRLLYAIVLYRLDNIVEARRELDELARQRPGDAEVAGYRAQAAKRSRKNHLSGRAGVGFQYDTNRNAAPGAGARLFGDAPVALPLSSQRRDDTSLLFLGNIDARRSVGSQEVFATVDYFRAEQTLVKTLNLQAYSVSAGAALHRAKDSLTPALVFDHVLLAQSTYLRSRGLDVRYEHAGAGGDVYLQAREVFQDFVANAVVPVAPERTGVQFDATAGFDRVLTPTMRFGAGYTHGFKHAGKHYNAYQRDGLSLNHIWLVGGGTFLMSNAALTYDRYDQPDTVLSSKFRRDTALRASATYGVPLSLLQDRLKDFLWTFSYEYYQALSSVQNFAYTNNKVGTLLTYKWDLGF